ncbi:heterokaryon incompatibility protein-domain-containing protein, partial [Lasiosphaeris hirsuta]
MNNEIISLCPYLDAPIPLTKTLKYQYPPLLKPGHTRLLRLMPDEQEDAGVQCWLFDYPLHDSGRGMNLYEALSYTWGDMDSYQSISINQRDMRVTPSLHTALLHLRDPYLERFIWVDALCINQCDPNEKGHQVQSMAKIYAKAGRVIVWLGEAADGSDQAIEVIRVASTGQPPTPLDKTSQQAILGLLQRTWFQRIWVLQEVAAARHVLIKCGSTEIDGYAFCVGLHALNFPFEAYPDLQSLIPTTTYLIRDAPFRPRCVTNRSGRFSLQIRPLRVLVDMYHTRKATDSRDKVFALLGMSSDDGGEATFSADYTASWGQIFRQSVHYFLSNQVSVDTWDDKEIAVIRGKGCILGEVYSIGDVTWKDAQTADIVWRNATGYLGSKEKGNSRWTLQSGAKPVEVGDAICLLQGAPRPTVVRQRHDHWVIIRVAVQP